MARYSAEHKKETHAKVLKTAGALFRKQGYVATGVEKLMRSAGLTQGGFYGHFSSKTELLKAAITYSFTETRAKFLGGLEEKEGGTWHKQMVRRFINSQHRDDMSSSCPTTSLATEVARSSDDVKAVFEQEVLKTIKEMEKKLPSQNGLSPRERALNIVMLGIGAITLSRAVKNKTLSDQILSAARKLAEKY